MKKLNYFLWYFPIIFFLFISLFIFVKFIFIFFFKAAFEPGFIFDLTPFYLLSGINNLHLLFLSTALILSDAYLHIKSTRRCLIYSYLPTSLMLSGLVLTIIFREISISYVYHYFIFGCMLLIVLIDHKHILAPIETLEKKPMTIKIEEKKPVAILTKPISAEAKKIFTYPKLTTEADKTFDIMVSFEIILEKIQALFEVIERKTIKLEKLENEIEESRKNLIQQEKMFIDSLNYYKPRDRFDIGDKNLSSIDQIFITDKIKDHLVIDETTDCIAVVQRGILKQINNSFADFLGYNINELINKSLFGFFTPKSIENVKNYHLDRLKGVVSNSYKTVFVTKDYNEIPVEIFVEPTIYKGEAAEILVVKGIKNR